MPSTLESVLIIDPANVSYEGCFEAGEITPPPPPPPPPPTVAIVVVTLAAISIKVGQTVQAIATPKDIHGNILSGRVVSWFSSIPTVASVSASGLVTGLASGNVFIRATVELIQGTAPLSVTPDIIIVDPPPVDSVTVALSSPTINQGETTQAIATPRDSGDNILTGRPIVWSSVTPAIATVSPTGLVTGISGGTVLIRATVGTVQGSASLIVIPTIIISDPPPPPQDYFALLFFSSHYFSRHYFL